MLLRNVQVGVRLKADGGFTCLKKGAIRTVKASGDPKRLFIRCAKGRHFLDGQVDFATGKVVVGLSVVGRR